MSTLDYCKMLTFGFEWFNLSYRYRELFTILERAEEINKLRGDEGEETDKMRMEEMGGMSYEELCEWAVGEMEDVFSERLIFEFNKISKKVSSHFSKNVASFTYFLCINS